MHEIRIYYEDTDAEGVVYYANYLRYFERARTEYLEERGLDIKGLLDNGILFIVARVEIDYKSPAKLYDTIQVETTISEVSKASFWLDYIIKRKQDGKIIVTGRTRMACINRDHKLIRLPRDIAGKLT